MAATEQHCSPMRSDKKGSFLEESKVILLEYLLYSPDRSGVTFYSPKRKLKYLFERFCV